QGYSFNGLICVIEPGESLVEEFIDFCLNTFENCFVQISNKVYQSNIKDKEYLLSLQRYIKSETLRQKIKPVLIHDAYCLDEEHQHLREILIKQGGVGFQNMTEGHFMKSSKRIIIDFIKLFDNLSY